MKTKRLPSHAAKLLTPNEEVHYLTRPRWVSLQILLVFGSIVLVLAICSVLLEDPGFFRLASLPGFPLMGSYAAHLTLSPVVFVTDHRIISARRWNQPLSIDFEKLRKIRIQQSRLQRLLGFGEMSLLIDPIQNPRPGVFVQFTLSRLPDAIALETAIATFAGACSCLGQSAEG
jgi:hypothetical protein